MMHDQNRAVWGICPGVNVRGVSVWGYNILCPWGKCPGVHVWRGSVLSPFRLHRVKHAFKIVRISYHSCQKVVIWKNDNFPVIIRVVLFNNKNIMIVVNLWCLAGSFG